MPTTKNVQVPRTQRGCVMALTRAPETTSNSRCQTSIRPKGIKGRTEKAVPHWMHDGSSSEFSRKQEGQRFVDKVNCSSFLRLMPFGPQVMVRYELLRLNFYNVVVVLRCRKPSALCQGALNLQADRHFAQEGFGPANP